MSHDSMAAAAPAETFGQMAELTTPSALGAAADQARLAGYSKMDAY
jgi:hypothetical protein